MAMPLFIKSIQPPAAKPKAAPAKEKAKPDEAEQGDGDISHFHHLLGVLSTHRAGGDFGQHNVEPGHHVAFKAGSFSGSGKVCTTGRDGLTVLDDGNREHRIHYREITGHFAPEKKKKNA